MRVWYMNGAGNDFLVLDGRGRNLDLPDLAVKLCKPKNADGFMAVDHSQAADFRLHFYNSDGSRAAMCGNGARCVCRFARENGIAGDSMTVETDAGILHGQYIRENRYRIRMPPPGIPDLSRKPGCAYVEVGVPHVVCRYSGDLWADAFQLKAHFRRLRHDPAFPHGANVNFYTRTDANSVRVLTFERGVEDYTLACGTGCCAVATVLRAAGKLPGGKLITENRGGILTVTVTENTLFLEGDTEVEEIFEI